MSSICGVFYRKAQDDTGEFEAVMHESGKYRSDTSQTYSDSCVCLGCHLKRVVPESQNEVLPYEDAGLVITADAIIDNREELFSLLTTPKEQQDMPDSVLVLRAYQKWGTVCPEKLVGDFAFSIWDKEKETLFCARDHIGRKTFYYHLSKSQFAFSTLIKPLLKLNGLEGKLNDTYISDFLSLPSVVHELDPRITIYEEVSQLPPASAMLIQKDYNRVWQYWKIKRTKEIQFETVEDYEKAFIRIYDEAVRCRLRCSQKVGVTLSGGLDSGSVACLAARELKKRGETLYSYTQVPMEGYQNWLPEHQLADEREYVLSVCDFCGNIKPSFLSCEGVNSLTEAERLLEIMEQPYKFIENSYWLCEILKTSSDMGVGVILNGQLGNFTVSWGSYMPYFLHLLKKLRFISFFREVAAYCRTEEISPLSYHRSILHQLLPLSLVRYIYQMHGGEDSVYLSSPINMKFYQAMRESKRQNAFGVDPIYLKFADSYHQRLKLLNPAIFSHIGAVQAKLSMAYGVEQRDPTADKRLIEFCLNLPEKLWLRGDMQRGLIRSAMKGIIPDKLRLNLKYRGRQSADWVQRIIPDWDKARAEISKIGASSLEKKYLDIPRIREFLKKNHDLDYRDDGVHGLRLLLRALIFSRFLRNHEH